MNIIKIDAMRRNKICKEGPTLTFYKNGKILFNSSAKQLINCQDGNYLHFYEGDNNQYWIKLDNTATHGINISESKKGVLSAYSRHLKEYILKDVNQMKFLIESDDFGKFKLLLIN